MPPRFNESTVEQAALDWLTEVGWTHVPAARFVPGESDAERTDFNQVILQHRLLAALARLNPDLPPAAFDDALRRLQHIEGTDLAARNRALHLLLVKGVTVEYRLPGGEVRGGQVRVIDWDEPGNNDWLAVDQFTVKEGQHTRRADLVLFVNGLPLVVMELKNAITEQATVRSAFNQFQTYKAQIPSLFTTNELLVVSDGRHAMAGTLTAGYEWFKPWRTIGGDELATRAMPELQVLIQGLLAPEHFLAFVRDFIVFEDDGSGVLAKKMAQYHQFHAVDVAVEETLRASEMHRGPQVQQSGGQPGDRRVGVVWHTQGSGKSLTMAFYAGRIVREPAMQNPTVVVLTDRNDLDDQLFGTFSLCADLLRQTPVQAGDRAHLQRLLSVTSGGVVFTTIQKFLPDEKGARYPVLSERRNIVVIADEAHRSQYDFIDGFAAHMRDALPHASFIGFTGTPIELRDANTRAVFGDYISVYDIQMAVADGATVPIYYESRLAKLALDESQRPNIDPDFEEVTEGEEVERKEKLKSKWAQLEAVVGAEKRIQSVAQDIVDHFEQRQSVLDGKGMIVTMSRRIAVDLYDAIAKLRPDWVGEDDGSGALKVVMTGSASDPVDWQTHIRNKPRREVLAKRFRDAKDPFKLVIVRDMWLTGFDAPSLHTMYLDKPMQAHGLMQTIARVNRVFESKPGGLVVDYIGLALELKKALHTYTESGGKGDTAVDQGEAVALMLEKYETAGAMLHGFDRGAWWNGSPGERLALLPAAQDHILAQEDGKARFTKLVRELSQAFALSVPHDETQRIRDDVGFMQQLSAVLNKASPHEARDQEDLDQAVRQIISRAVAPGGVIDIFAAAGLQKPDISILSEEFLAEIRGMEHRNLAIELLRKLLSGEIKERGRKNAVQARSFAEMLESTLRRYQNRAITAAQVIEEMIQVGRDLRTAGDRGAALGLTEDEVAFYDALETNDSAVKVLGDDKLRLIAVELVEAVRKNVTIDWTLRESVRAQIRVMVRRILRKHGYPPDLQAKATKTVLEQAELLSAGWAAA